MRVGVPGRACTVVGAALTMGFGILTVPAHGQTGESLTLARAVEIALSENPSIAEAAEAVRAQQSRVRSTAAALKPQFDVHGNLYRQGPVIPAFRQGASDVVPAYRWDVGLGFSQLILDWGQRRSEKRAASHLEEAARHRLTQRRSDVRLVVSTAYYNALRAQSMVEVAAERLRAAREQLRVAQARFEAGAGARFEVFRAEAEVAAGEQEVVTAESDIRLSEAALSVAMGRPPRERLRLETPAGIPLPSVNTGTARDQALARRPELAALDAESRSHEASASARRMENKPQLFAGASYDRRNQTGFSATYTYNSGLTLTFPLADGGLTRSRVRESEAEKRRALEQLKEARLRVELEVREAIVMLDSARSRISSAEKELAAAREGARVAEVRYRTGIGTSVEYTDAQAAAARAGQNLAAARFELGSAVARLEHATGEPQRE